MKLGVPRVGWSRLLALTRAPRTTVHRTSFLAAATLVAVVLLAGVGTAQLSETFTNWSAHPAVAYGTHPPTDPIAVLNHRLENGSLRLGFSGRSGYLHSTLDALDIAVESQVLVFSPDSLQGQRISTVNPRAIFFGDGVSLAWVRGGFMEAASQDPQLGMVFYVLENVETDRPQFVRREDCLQCHFSRQTVGVPGMVDQGYGQLAVDHRTPVERRWGGWYVTGQPSSLHHLGNHVARTASTPEVTPASSIWPSLDGRFDTDGYLSTQSDVVALLVFNHQMRGMNLLARFGWEARVAEFQAAHVESPLARPAGALTDTPVSLDAAARELVDYFLFVDEARFDTPVRGLSGFAERFEQQGPRDRQGRSLRQLDLRTRLLRYPCSYLIYTPAFDALPSIGRAAIYRRMWDVLSGVDKDPRYRRLSADDRRNIVDILRDTKTDLPLSFT
jgi:hypothetical protein